MSKNFGFTLALIAAVIIAVIIIGSRAIHVSASESTPAPEKHYVSYEVQPGDSLWSLAEERCIAGNCSVSDYIDEVKKVNRMTTDRIICGSRLYLICYD